MRSVYIWLAMQEYCVVFKHVWIVCICKPYCSWYFCSLPSSALQSLADYKNNTTVFVQNLHTFSKVANIEVMIAKSVLDVICCDFEVNSCYFGKAHHKHFNKGVEALRGRVVRTVPDQIFLYTLLKGLTSDISVHNFEWNEVKQEKLEILNSWAFKGTRNL